jgi:Cd2+/Zn2+-exporting ATPase/Cu+-exporting ATPase
VLKGHHQDMATKLELRVAELDCADEAQQIQAALGRVDGVLDVTTAVSSRTTVVAYDPHRVDADGIKRAIAGLGMTVTTGRAPLERGRRSLGHWLGWAFVSVIAVVTLLGIAGEQLGLVEAVVERIPAWIAVAAVLGGGYPIFLNVVRALRNRTVTSPH